MDFTRKLLVMLLVAFALIAICQAQRRGGRFNKKGNGNVRNNGRNNGNNENGGKSTGNQESTPDASTQEDDNENGGKSTDSQESTPDASTQEDDNENGGKSTSSQESTQEDDDTVEDEPITPRTCVAGQDIIFAVDSSGSIGTTNFNQMSNSLLTLIASFSNLDYPGNSDPTSIRAGILTFSSIAETVKELNDYNIPQSLTYAAGGTNTADAIMLAENMFTPAKGDRSLNLNVLAILTDGQSNNMILTIDAANHAKANGIKILAVGIGPGYDEQELRDMVSDSNTDVYNVTNFDQLGTELTKLFGCI